MDVDALMDTMRAELMTLDQPIATWHCAPVPRSGPGNVETAPGETAVVTDTFDLLLVTPGAEATAATRRQVEAIERAVKDWSLESFTPETVAGVLCAEIIQTNRQRGLDTDSDRG